MLAKSSQEDACDEVLVEARVVANLNGAKAAFAAEAVSFSSSRDESMVASPLRSLPVAPAAASAEVEAGPACWPQSNRSDLRAASDLLLRRRRPCP